MSAPWWPTLSPKASSGDERGLCFEHDKPSFVDSVDTVQYRRGKSMNTKQEPQLNHVQCLDTQGLHRMAYWEWGDAANPRVVICAHGLSRQGRDFDTLAAALSSDFRVVAPDVVGRGESDWLSNPAGYQLPAYVADMVTLLARL